MSIPSRAGSTGSLTKGASLSLHLVLSHMVSRLEGWTSHQDIGKHCGFPEDDEAELEPVVANMFPSRGFTEKQNQRRGVLVNHRNISSTARAYHVANAASHRHFSSSVPVLSTNFPPGAEIDGVSALLHDDNTTENTLPTNTTLTVASKFEHNTIQDIKKVLYPERFQTTGKVQSGKANKKRRVLTGFPSLDEIQQQDIPYFGQGSARWREALSAGVEHLEKRFKNKKRKLDYDLIHSGYNASQQMGGGMMIDEKIASAYPKRPQVYFHQKHLEAALMYCGLWEKALIIGASKLDVVTSCLAYKDHWNSALSIISSSLQNADHRAGASLSSPLSKLSRQHLTKHLANVPAYTIGEDEQLLNSSSVCRDLLLKIPQWSTAIALLERYNLRGGRLERQNYVDLAERHVEPVTKVMINEGPSQLRSQAFRYHQWEIASRVFDMVAFEHEGLAELQVAYQSQGLRAAYATALLRRLSKQGESSSVLKESEDEVKGNDEGDRGRVKRSRSGARIPLIEYCRKDSFLLGKGIFATNGSDSSSMFDTLSGVAAQSMGTEEPEPESEQQEGFSSSSISVSSTTATTTTSQWVHALLAMCPNPDTELKTALYDFCVQNADWSTALRLHDYFGSSYESRKFAKELAFEQFRSKISMENDMKGSHTRRNDERSHPSLSTTAVSTNTDEEVGIKLFESYSQKGIAIPTMGARLLNMCVAGGSAWQGALKVLTIMQKSHFNVPLVKVRDVAEMLLRNKRHGEVLQVRHWVRELASSGARANASGREIFSQTNFDELALKALSERSKSLGGRALALERNKRSRELFFERVIKTLAGVRLINDEHIRQALDAVFWELEPSQEIVAMGLAHGLDLKKRPSSRSTMTFSQQASDAVVLAGEGPRGEDTNRQNGELIELLTLPPLKESILYRMRVLHREHLRIMKEYALPLDSTRVMVLLEMARKHDEWNYKKLLLSKKSSERMRGQLPGAAGSSGPLWGIHNKLVQKDRARVPTHEVDQVVAELSSMYPGREELLDRIRESVINGHAYF